MPAPHGPLVIQPSHIDLGDVVAGHEVRARFVLSNQGELPVRLTAITHDCACVVPTALQDRITQGNAILQPGSTEDVVIQIRTERGEGRISPRITIATDAPDQPSVVLNATVHVVAAIQVEPPVVLLGNALPFDRPGTGRTTIIWRGSEPLRLGDARPSDPRIRATLSARPDGVTFDVVCRVDPPHPLGTWTSAVWIDIKQPAGQPIAIPLRATVVDPSAPSR